MGTGVRFERGAIVVVPLDPVVGHEQGGRRPCVVVSDPDVSGHQRFPTLCLVPLTSTSAPGALYPSVGPGPRSGLSRPSFAMVDHLRSVDKRRVRGIMGRVTLEEMQALDLGLRLFLAV